VTRGSAAGAAIARAARRRTKQARWIEELAADGWAVVQAGHIVLLANQSSGGATALNLRCGWCGAAFSEWGGFDVVETPLPQVLHAVSGHTCEERP
jgi:hypothetical protein